MPAKSRASSSQPDFNTSPFMSIAKIHPPFDMAEVVGMATNIKSVLKTLTYTGVFLQAINNASREAQEIANLVYTTEAILKSLHGSLKSIHWP
jgi:hypothetical protein